MSSTGMLPSPAKKMLGPGSSSRITTAVRSTATTIVLQGENPTEYDEGAVAADSPIADVVDVLDGAEVAVPRKNRLIACKRGCRNRRIPLSDTWPLARGRLGDPSSE